ncbi:MAG: succinate dehydrogenase assembly factor 2 [Gammaproteobacteria bacterium]
MNVVPSLVAIDPEELGKLRWRCRRGMKELDVLLERYMDERFCGASQAEQQAFKRLLETQDPVLYGYCLGSEPPPPQFLALIERITLHSSADRNSPTRR